MHDTLGRLEEVRYPDAPGRELVRRDDATDPLAPSMTTAAGEARVATNGGATLHRAGVLGRSAGPEGQFWSLANPLSPGYAARYGVPAENMAIDFVETARLRPGASFITREAPGLGANAGGAIEVVVNPGGVSMTGFFMP